MKQPLWRGLLQPAVWVLFSLFPLGGCVGYQVLRGDEDVRPGEAVRVHLSQAGAQGVGWRVGAEPRRLEGTLVEASADSLRLAVNWGGYALGTPLINRLDTVAVARSHILELQRRRFSVARTAALVAGGVWVAARLLRSVSGRRGGEIPVPADPPF